MTPKEKAKQLVISMSAYCQRYKHFSNGDIDFDEKTTLEYSKKCALTVVNEIIAENKLFPYNTIFYERINFWEQVKQEINGI